MIKRKSNQSSHTYLYNTGWCDCCLAIVLSEWAFMISENCYRGLGNLTITCHGNLSVQQLNIYTYRESWQFLVWKLWNFWIVALFFNQNSKNLMLKVWTVVLKNNIDIDIVCLWDVTIFAVFPGSSNIKVKLAIMKALYL